MLTRLIEGKKIKAHCYWPSTVGQSETFGDITVELDSVESEDKIIKRYFKIQKADELETLQVLHIHYTEWPDFGVPESAKNILNMINDTENFKNSVKAPSSSPVIVHCSAGVGRTGTYITIVSYLDHKKGGNPIPFNTQATILNLRDQRVGMVQTVEQYTFIINAIDTL